MATDHEVAVAVVEARLALLKMIKEWAEDEDTDVRALHLLAETYAWVTAPSNAHGQPASFG